MRILWEILENQENHNKLRNDFEKIEYAGRHSAKVTYLVQVRLKLSNYYMVEIALRLKIRDFKIM